MNNVLSCLSWSCLHVAFQHKVVRNHIEVHHVEHLSFGLATLPTILLRIDLLPQFLNPQ